jgi:hypothetical protein
MKRNKTSGVQQYDRRRPEDEHQIKEGITIVNTKCT